MEKIDKITGATKHPVIWKYLPNMDCPELEIPRFESLLPPKEYSKRLNNFQHIIKKSGLDKYQTELLIIWSYFGIKWKTAIFFANNGGYSDGTKQDKELLILKKVFTKRKTLKIKRVIIEFKNQKGQKEKAEISFPLIGSLVYFIKWGQLIKYIFKISSFKALFPKINQNRSYISVFSQEFIPVISDFLTKETGMEDTWEFIKNFGESFGMNWEDFTRDIKIYIMDKKKPSQR